MQIVEAQWT